jgi:mono/diheme cytochrome c family protein
VTEIPEHLLKRAAQRRAAMTGGDAPADAPADAAPAAGAPAADAPAAAAPAKKAPAPLPSLDAEPAKVVPDIPVVAAAKARKRVPYWATALLASMPLWAFMYYFSIAEPPAQSTGALAMGAEVYSAKCAACHQPAGQGGATGQKLSEGEVLKTFADPLTMVHWIAYGYEDGARADGTYGDLDRPGGPHNVDMVAGNMGAWRDLISAEELAAVTIYIREELSGGDPADDPSFNVETFDADPAGAEAMVEAVIEIGATGDPDVSGIEGAETE